MLVLHSAQALEVTNLHKLRSLDYILHRPLCSSLCIHLEVWNPLGLLSRENPWQFWVQNNKLLLLRGLPLKTNNNALYTVLMHHTLMHWNLCNNKAHKQNKPQLIFNVIKYILPCTGNAPHWYIQRSNTRLHWSRCDSSYSCLSFIKTILSYELSNH